MLAAKKLSVILPAANTANSSSRISYPVSAGSTVDEGFVATSREHADGNTAIELGHRIASSQSLLNPAAPVRP